MKYIKFFIWKNWKYNKEKKHSHKKKLIEYNSTENAKRNLDNLIQDK